MTIEFDNKKTNVYIKEKMKARGIKDYKDLAHRMFKLHSGFTKESDFQTNVNRWFCINSGLPTRDPASLLALSRVLGVSIEELILGADMDADSDRVTLYSVAKSNNPLLYEKLKQDPEVKIDSYDERDKSFIDYVVEFKSSKILEQMISDSDWLCMNGELIRNFYHINVGKLLFMAADCQDQNILGKVFNPVFDWEAKVTDESDSDRLSQRIFFNKGEALQALKNPAFLAYVTKPTEIQSSDWVKWRYGREPLRSSAWINLPILFGGFNALFDLAIESKNQPLISAFAKAGLEHNKIIVNRLNGIDHLVKGDLVYFSREGRTELAPVANVAMPANLKRLEASDIFQEYPVVKEYLDSLCIFKIKNE
jgi:hypothetical protein